MSESSKVSVNYFCIGAFLIFMGSILFCTFGFTVVLPFQVTRQWPKVNCRVVNSSFDLHLCSCDEGYSGWDEEISARFKHRQKSMKPKNAQAVFDTTNNSSSDLSGSLFFSSPLTFSPSPALQFSSNCFNRYPCLKIYVQYKEAVKKKIATTTISTIPTTAITTNSDTIFVTDTISPTANSTSDSYAEEQTESENEMVEEIEELYTNFSNKMNNVKIESNKNDTDLNLIQNNGNLKQVAQLYRSWDDSFYAQCTLIECGEDVWNTKVNSRFQKNWGVVGSSYPCYYDPNHKDVAILEITSSTMAFHAIFWPVMCFVSGATLWACLCAGCCKDKQSKCKEKNRLKA